MILGVLRLVNCALISRYVNEYAQRLPHTHTHSTHTELYMSVHIVLKSYEICLQLTRRLNIQHVTRNRIEMFRFCFAFIRLKMI